MTPYWIIIYIASLLDTALSFLFSFYYNYSGLLFFNISPTSDPSNEAKSQFSLVALSPNTISLISFSHCQPHLSPALLTHRHPDLLFNLTVTNLEICEQKRTWHHYLQGYSSTCALKQENHKECHMPREMGILVLEFGSTS
jgi:hypothetical protein